MRVRSLPWAALLSIPLLLSCSAHLMHADFVAVRSAAHCSTPEARVNVTLVNEAGNSLVGTTVELVSKDSMLNYLQVTDVDGKAVFKAVRKGRAYKVMASTWCKKKPFLVGEFAIADEQSFDLYISVPSQMCPPQDPL